MSPALYFTAARYLVAWACGILVQRGWSIANLDGATMDAVAQIAVGVVGASAMLLIGVVKTMVSSIVARLKNHHAPELLDAAASVPGVTKIVASPQLASATDSSKVVGS